MEEIKGTVRRVTYYSDETGYGVLKIANDESLVDIPVIGYMAPLGKGTPIIATGAWKVSEKYGRQFAATTVQEVLPVTEKGIINYLAGGFVKGIGKVQAQSIVEKFGTDTLEIIEKTPERLTEIKGIGKKKAKSIAESWDCEHSKREAMLFLKNYDVTDSFANRIYKQYGSDTIKKVKENPYILADDLHGVGFRKADEIALKMGIDINSTERCMSGLQYALQKIVEEGNIYSPRNRLLDEARELLFSDMKMISTTLDKMIKDGILIEEENAIYDKHHYSQEMNVAEKLKKLRYSSFNTEIDSSVDFDILSARTGITYDDAQKDAIRRAITADVMVITGGPGVGKTTVLNGVITVLRNRGMDVLLAAPTGRAAKRMTEATGMHAQTIHRLLGYRPPYEFKYDAYNRLEGDALIIDESSMIDITLMSHLVDAIPPWMKLILVGDVDQLPSVGPGAVLKDIIDSEVFPVVKLTKIFRQAEKSRIITNAHLINKGEMPVIENGEEDNDFFFIKREAAKKKNETDEEKKERNFKTAEMIEKEILSLVSERLPAYYGISPKEIQVLSPMKKGKIGTDNLNEKLQALINPDGTSITHGKRIFRVNDKVMQIKNNYDKGVFNGDIGIITEIDKNKDKITITFDTGSREYEKKELSQIVLAYCTTVHKSQGSEHPIVVMPVSWAHYMLLQRSIIYTGLTRAKELAVIVGSKRALKFAVEKEVVSNRCSHLIDRLQAV